MRKAHVHHSAPERVSFRLRFEDVAESCPQDVTSFFFDLKLVLPPGLTASDFHRARLAVERRLLRTVRKKDRIIWTADGFFLAVATTDPARAGAVAERVHQDVCAALGTADTATAAVREVEAEAADPIHALVPGIDELHASRVAWLA